jgi:hypothetical protein
VRCYVNPSGSGVPLRRTRWSSESEQDRFVVEDPATGAPAADVIRAQADELAALETLERDGYGTCPLRVTVLQVQAAGMRTDFPPSRLVGPARAELKARLVGADIRGSQKLRVRNGTAI